MTPTTLSLLCATLLMIGCDIHKPPTKAQCITVATMRCHRDDATVNSIQWCVNNEIALCQGGHRERCGKQAYDSCLVLHPSPEWWCEHIEEKDGSVNRTCNWAEDPEVHRKKHSKCRQKLTNACVKKEYLTRIGIGSQEWMLAQ